MKTPGVMLLMSSSGIDPYRLHTSRLQKPRISRSISDKNSMKSSVFFKCAGICLSRGLRDLLKYLESKVAGVSVAASIGLPFNSPSLWSFGKQYTGQGSGSLQIFCLKFLYSVGNLIEWLIEIDLFCSRLV